MAHIVLLPSCVPVKVKIDEPVMLQRVWCGEDGTMFLSDVGSVFACGSNENNKLGLNNRQGFLMAMKNIFTKVGCSTLYRTFLFKHLKYYCQVSSLNCVFEQQTGLPDGHEEHLHKGWLFYSVQNILACTYS